jgi:hypothetical protein
MISRTASSRAVARRSSDPHIACGMSRAIASTSSSISSRSSSTVARAPPAAAAAPAATRPQRRASVRALAASKPRHGAVVARPSARFGVVVGRFNDLVTKLLLEGAMGAFESHGASLDNVEVRRARHAGGGGG